MSHDHSVFDPTAWRALRPAQQDAQMRLLVLRMHRARNRAIGQALLGAMATLCGGWPRAISVAALPVIARRRHWPRLAPRRREF